MEFKALHRLMGCQIKRLGQANSNLPLSKIFITMWCSKLGKTAQNLYFWALRVSFFAFNFFLKELRFPDPVHLALEIGQKPRVIACKSQLFKKKRYRPLNTGWMPLKKAKNYTFSLKKVALKLLLVSFWARMTSIFHAHQFFINSEHILDVFRAKNNFFSNFSSFSPPGGPPNATTTP